jgi:hypothetical protein
VEDAEEDVVVVEEAIPCIDTGGKMQGRELGFLASRCLALSLRRALFLVFFEPVPALPFSLRLPPFDPLL